MKAETIPLPVATHHLAHGTVVTFGGNNHPLLALEATLARQRCRFRGLITPPANHDGPGFRKILASLSGARHAADGAYIGSGEGVAIQSRDCPIVVIHDSEAGHTVVCHAGRPALSPERFGPKGSPKNVLGPALGVLGELGCETSKLSVYITAAICPRCFVHEGKVGWPYVNPFHSTYPGTVQCKHGNLDLIEVIKMELERHGVPRTSVKHDGLCTKERSPRSSHRNGDTINNVVLVTRD